MTVFKLWNVIPLVFFPIFIALWWQIKQNIHFCRLFRCITTHETVNIIIVKRSVTTETCYDIVYCYTLASRKFSGIWKLLQKSMEEAQHRLVESLISSRVFEPKSTHVCEPVVTWRRIIVIVRRCASCIHCLPVYWEHTAIWPRCDEDLSYSMLTQCCFFFLHVGFLSVSQHHPPSLAVTHHHTCAWSDDNARAVGTDPAVVLTMLLQTGWIRGQELLITYLRSNLITRNRHTTTQNITSPQQTCIYDTHPPAKHICCYCYCYCWLLPIN